MDEAAFREALVSAVGDQKSAFRSIFPKAPSQQRLLKLIARQGRLVNPTSQPVLREIKVTPAAVQKAIQALAADDLIEEDADGGLVIVRGLFREWLSGDYD